MTIQAAGTQSCDFTGTARAVFNGVDATNLHVSRNKVTCVTPAGTAGAVPTAIFDDAGAQADVNPYTYA